MCGRDRPARHGLARGTGVLGGILERGREIAQECLRMVGLAPRGDERPTAVVSREPAGAEEQLLQLRRLREMVAREAGSAGLAMPGPCPGMDGAATPGGGEAS